MSRIARVVDPDNNGNSNDAGAMLLPRETFTDAVSGISVTGATASGYDLTISISGSDTTAPKGTVSINGGASSTARSIVRLTLSVADEGGSVENTRLSNDGTNWSGWEFYTPSKMWRLSAGAGKKTVYAQFRDRAGNVRDVASDTIRRQTSR